LHHRAIEPDSIPLGWSRSVGNAPIHTALVAPPALEMNV
jgi:hypothetical protein